MRDLWRIFSSRILVCERKRLMEDVACCSNTFLSFFLSARLRHAPRSRKKSICTIRAIGDGFDMGWARCNQLFQQQIVLHRVTVLELVKFALILHFCRWFATFSRLLFSLAFYSRIVKFPGDLVGANRKYEYIWSARSIKFEFKRRFNAHLSFPRKLPNRIFKFSPLHFSILLSIAVQKKKKNPIQFREIDGEGKRGKYFPTNFVLESRSSNGKREIRLDCRSIWIGNWRLFVRSTRWLFNVSYISFPSVWNI